MWRWLERRSQLRPESARDAAEIVNGKELSEAEWASNASRWERAWDALVSEGAGLAGREAAVAAARTAVDVAAAAVKIANVGWLRVRPNSTSAKANSRPARKA